jgi:hypothetical protein
MTSWSTETCTIRKKLIAAAGECDPGRGFERVADARDETRTNARVSFHPRHKSTFESIKDGPSRVSPRVCDRLLLRFGWRVSRSAFVSRRVGRFHRALHPNPKPEPNLARSRSKAGIFPAAPRRRAARLILSREPPRVGECFSEGRAGSRRGGRRRVSGPERPRLGVAPSGPAADSAGSVTVRGHRADSPRAPDVTSGREGKKTKKTVARTERSGPGRLGEGRRRRSSVAPGKNPSRPHARLHARTPLS